MPREWPCGPWPHGLLSTPAGARKQRVRHRRQVDKYVPHGAAERASLGRARPAATALARPRCGAGAGRAGAPSAACIGWPCARARPRPSLEWRTSGEGATGSSRARTARAAAARAGRCTDGRSAGASTPCCRALPRERPPPRQPRGAVTRGWSRRGGPRGAHLGCALARLQVHVGVT